MEWERGVSAFTGESNYIHCVWWRGRIAPARGVADAAGKM